MKYFLLVLLINTLVVAFGFVALFLPAAAIGMHFGLGWSIVYIIIAVSLYIYKAELHSW